MSCRARISSRRPHRPAGWWGLPAGEIGSRGPSGSAKIAAPVIIGPRAHCWGSLQAPSACHVSVGPFRGEEGELPSKCRGQGLVLGMGGRGMDPGSPGRGRTRNFGVLSLAGVFFLAPVASLVPELPSLGFENTTIPFNWACLIHTTSGIIWPSRMGDFDRRSLPLHFSRHSFFDDRFCLLLERSTTATADPCRS